jgi:hypothetical protein
MRAVENGGNFVRIDRVNGKFAHELTLGMHDGFAMASRVADGLPRRLW